MAKVLVLYDTKTGNTKKMAEYVAEGAARVATTEVRLKSIAEAGEEDVLWCDGIAVGSPTHVGIMSNSMKRFWDQATPDLWGKIDGRIGCAFSSSGGWGGGSEMTCQSILTVLINFGLLVFGVPDYTGEGFTLHYGVALAGEPRAEQEIEACRRLGERLAQWVGVYFDGRAELRPPPFKER
jgi:NAD(P)H dehydrogenase (quinone)